MIKLSNKFIEKKIQNFIDIFEIEFLSKKNCEKKVQNFINIFEFEILVLGLGFYIILRYNYFLKNLNSNHSFGLVLKRKKFFIIIINYDKNIIIFYSHAKLELLSDIALNHSF